MARRKQPAISDELLDQLLAGADAKTTFAKDGLLDELKKALAERALNAEIDHHLDKGEEDGRLNSRNGYGRKSVLTDTGKIELEVPRDRLSTFDPQLIAKYQRRFPGFDDKIDFEAYVSAKIEEATAHLKGLGPVQLDTIRNMLREQMASDPALEPIVPTPTPQPIITPPPVHTSVITGTHSGDGAGSSPLGPTPLPAGQIRLTPPTSPWQTRASGAMPTTL